MNLAGRNDMRGVSTCQIHHYKTKFQNNPIILFVSVSQINAKEMVVLIRFDGNDIDSIFKNRWLRYLDL